MGDSTTLMTSLLLPGALRAFSAELSRVVIPATVLNLQALQETEATGIEPATSGMTGKSHTQGSRRIAIPRSATRPLEAVLGPEIVDQIAFSVLAEGHPVEGQAAFQSNKTLFVLRKRFAKTWRSI
jgi:hypothetical protein